MSINPSIQNDWKDLIAECLARNDELQKIIGTLVVRGCSLSFIAEALDEHLELRSDYRAITSPPSYKPSYKSTCDYDLVANPPLLRNATANLNRRADKELQLYTLDDFLSADECEALVKLINSRLRPSIIARPTSDKY